MQRPKSNSIKEHKILLGCITFLLLVIVVVSITYIRATKMETQVKKEATEIAKEYANIKEVDSFYWFKRKEVYFTVVGKDNTGEQKVVIISQNTGKVKIVDQKDGWNEQEICQKTIDEYQETTIKEANLGMYDAKPVWEVVTQSTDGSLTYYLFSFETGEEVKVIQNI